MARRMEGRLQRADSDIGCQAVGRTSPDATRSPATAREAVALARAARKEGRLEDADALLEAAHARFPADSDLLIERGWVAHTRQDWPEATRLWATVRQRTPLHLVGYVNGAIAARELGERSQADALLVEAIARFPNVARPRIERAALASHARDWATAERLWQEVLARHADDVASHVSAARALREQARYAEAREVLRQAAERFPDAEQVAVEQCWLVHRARDWPAARQGWADLRARFPHLTAGYTNGALACRELRDFVAAEAILGDALQRFPDLEAVWQEHAWLATARRDWPESALRWSRVRERFPTRPEAYLREAAAYSEMWDHAKAEALLAAGMARFPEATGIALRHAQLAFVQSRFEDAADRYTALLSRFPDLIDARLGAALVLRSTFRLAEAEAALQAAQALAPQDPRLWLEYARIPVARPLKRDRQPEVALARFAIMRERFPDFLDGYLSSAHLLRDLGRFAEAEQVAEAGLKHLPDAVALIVEHATLATKRGDQATTHARFVSARARLPDAPEVAIGYGQALAAGARMAEAEAILRATRERFPNLKAAHIAYGRLAMQREDWSEALARWVLGQKRFPEDHTFAQGAYEARLHLTEDAGEAAAAVAGGEDAGEDTRTALRELVLRFESLGGRALGCEFGMLQREFGAEPLSLLRWADMPYEGIIQALETRFAGVGAPENTRVFVNHENGRPEYCSVDLRGFMFMRSFVYEDEMPIERMRKQILRRLTFLRDKLIADLQAGSKVFVWRCTERSLTGPEIARLHAAVRSYGDNTLLYVRLQDPDHPNGHVERQTPGLLVGYLDRFKMSPEGELYSRPATASWINLLRNAIPISDPALAGAAPMLATTG
jgi:tetratricopeptide (TPR) repeat protein